MQGSETNEGRTMTQVKAARAKDGAGKLLCFRHRGEVFKVNEKLQVRPESSSDLGPCYYKFDDGWRLLGFSSRPNCRTPNVDLEAVWRDPKLAVGSYVWDVDHGTTRMWSGMYEGKIPRVEAAWLEDAE